LIVLGRVTKPQGIKGEVRVVSFAQSDESFARFGHVLLRLGDGEVRRFDLIGLRFANQGPVLRLRGVEDRNAAELLVGAEVVVPRNELPEPEEGEFYWVDLIGLKVLNPAGESLGRVENLLETGANDVLVIRGPGGEEILAAAIDGVVVKVDLAAGEMIIDPPEEV